jgi:peptidoglycan-associated lipoprotein
MRVMQHFNYSSAAKFLVIGAQFIALSACSTNKPVKPAEATQIQPQQQMVAAARQSKTAASNSGSSLDAHREGKAPAAGPLKDIYFEFDQYNLGMDARDVLKSHSVWLKNNASGQLEIEGHCDERGTGEYNLALGAKRAQTAKDYLITLGVPAGRISTVSYGKELPVCQDHSEECWQKNRHDRFVVKNLPTA